MSKGPKFKNGSREAAEQFLAAYDEAHRLFKKKKRHPPKPKPKKYRLPWRARAAIHNRRVSIRNQNRKLQNRFLDSGVIQRVLARKICDHCHKPFRNQKEKCIHHEKPISLGGTNDEFNLRCVHKGNCHKEADAISFQKYGGKNAN